jgi:hypothetical protein
MYPGYYLLAIAQFQKDGKIAWIVDENGKVLPQNYIPSANLRKWRIHP